MQIVVHLLAKVYATVCVWMTFFFTIMWMVEHSYNFSVACQNNTAKWIIGWAIGGTVTGVIYDKTRPHRS